MNYSLPTARRGDLAPATSEEEAREARAKRIRLAYSPQRVRLIEGFEERYEDKYPSEGFDALAAILRRAIKFQAAKWSGQALRQGFRLYHDDFESVMWEEAWLVVQFRGRANPQYYLLEELELRFKSRALDLMRWARRQKRTQDLTAEPLPERDADDSLVDSMASRLEEHVANRELVADLLHDPSLDDDERRLLRYLYINHDAGYDEMAAELGLPHRMSAWRMVERIRRKLAWHDPDREGAGQRQGERSIAAAC